MTLSDSKSTSLLPALKQADPIRYAAVLYMPEDKRRAVASIWLFQTEIERIRDVVSEPLPGEIRLQWWRDVLEGMRDGEAKQNPLAVALLETIASCGLRSELFTSYLEAMTFELYDDPMQDRAQFEGYMGETHSVFFQVVSQILAGSPIQNGDAAGHAGVAFGAARCLVDMAKHRARGQVFVPSDILMMQSLNAETWRAVEENDRKHDAVKAFGALGEEHLAKAKLAQRDLPTSCHPAFLPLAVCSGIFAQARRKPSMALEGTAGPGPLGIQWAILKAALSGL